MKTNHFHLSIILALCLVQLRVSANAAVIISVRESEQDVIVLSSGELDLRSLSFFRTAPDSVAGCNASHDPPAILTGVQQFGTAVPADIYIGDIVAPSQIGGSIGNIRATSGVGDRFGVTFITDPELRPVIVVPAGYVSDDPILSSALFADTTLLGIGLVPGVYTWSWGAGAERDSITLVVPEPGVMLMIAVTAPSLVVLRRRRERRRRRKQQGEQDVGGKRGGG